MIKHKESIKILKNRKNKAPDNSKKLEKQGPTTSKKLKNKTRNYSKKLEK